MPDTLILTPTGDRPMAFAMCEWLMQRQENPPDYDWLVVDDGFIPTKVTKGQHYVRRYSHHADPQHTLANNLLMSLPVMREYDQCIIIEDDDFYGKHYLSTVHAWLKSHKMVGERDAKYVHLQHGYRLLKHPNHASMCRTAFTRDVYDDLESICHAALEQNKKVPLDMQLWKRAAGKLYVDQMGVSGLSVAIKGMPGRPNLQRKKQSYTPHDGTFRKWLQDDEAYERYMAMEYDRRPVVYSALFGPYDGMRTPRHLNKSVRYLMFTDQQDVPQGWEGVPLRSHSEPQLMSRMVKLLAHRAFWNAEWSLYHDANFALRGDPVALYDQMPEHVPLWITDNTHEQWNVSDEVKAVIDRGWVDESVVLKQMSEYQRNGYEPQNDRAVRAGIMLRRHTEQLGRFYEEWWKHVQRFTYRDQLAFGYVAESMIRYARIPREYRRKFFKKDPHLQDKPCRV